MCVPYHQILTQTAVHVKRMLNAAVRYACPLGCLGATAQHDGCLLENRSELQKECEMREFEANALGHARGGVNRAMSAVLAIRRIV